MKRYEISLWVPEVEEWLMYDSSWSNGEKYFDHAVKYYPFLKWRLIDHGENGAEWILEKEHSWKECDVIKRDKIIGNPF